MTSPSPVAGIGLTGLLRVCGLLLPLAARESVAGLLDGWRV